jgi:G3E family GTPase
MTTEIQIVTGFLGSGKTSVLLHLLGTASPAGRMGVVVGEFADEGYDGRLLEETGHEVRMVSGLAAQDRARALLPELIGLIETGQFLRVVLETSGVSEASELRDALLGSEELGRLARFGRTVTVLDASAFDAHRQHFAHQLTAQLRIADVVVVNKTDRVQPADLARVRKAVRELHPSADVHFAYMGQVSRPAVWSPFAEGQRPSLLTAVAPSGPVLDFDAFVYRTPRVCYDRVRFGHLLLNLPARVARFKGVLACHDRAYPINGMPGQLDWEKLSVRGATRIALIGLGIRDAEPEITGLLDAEIQRQHDELRR